MSPLEFPARHRRIPIDPELARAADAIVGVTLFSKQAPGDFDTFCRAFVSMFRITIGSVEWWFERFPAVEHDGSISWRTTAFLITYVILVNWFFFQVSIAVLFENFHHASKRMKVDKTLEAIRESQRTKQLSNPLDPLLLRLSKDFVDEEDLTKRLRELFKVRCISPSVKRELC